MKELGRWWGSRELSWWRGEGEGGWKKEASKVVRHTNNTAKQHSTPKAVTFPKEK